MKIVLISGKQGSGKTTLQNALSSTAFSKIGWLSTKVNFADVIYQIHDHAIGILAEHGIKRDIAKDGKLLQLLGTEWGRDTLGIDIWVQCLRNKLTNLERAQKFGLAIIADARFENEFDGFEDALRIRLECDESIRRKRCSAWRTDTKHPSEVGLDYYSKMGAFDLEFNTELESTVSMTETILQKLLEDDFRSKRQLVLPLT